MLRQSPARLTCIVYHGPQTVTTCWKIVLYILHSHLHLVLLLHVHVDQLEPGARLHPESLSPLTGRVLTTSKHPEACGEHSEDTEDTECLILTQHVKMSGHLMPNPSITASDKNNPA